MPVEFVSTRSLSEIINELKVELRNFVQTRIDLLRAELRDKVQAWKMAAPLLAIAAVFGLVGFLALTAALIAAIAWAIGWGYSALAVGLAWWAVAALCGVLAYRQVSTAGVMPERTVKVLKQDQAWVESEAKTERRVA